MTKIRTLVVDDEPIARERITSLLQQEQDVEVIGECADGVQAVSAINQESPDLVFLDVQMPGTDGFGVIQNIGADRMPTVVFVTAYDEYALKAFEVHALDYLLKPVEQARLAETVSRLKERLRSSRPAINTEQLLQQLSAQLSKLQRGGKREPLRWIRAQAGKTVRLIAIDDVDYLRSDAKYTLVAWHDGGKPAEAVVRTPLKDLLEQLDPDQFAQVHRSIVVNLRAISHVKRHDNETAEIHLKGRNDLLPVSRNYLHLFRQM